MTRAARALGVAMLLAVATMGACGDDDAAESPETPATASSESGAEATSPTAVSETTAGATPPPSPSPSPMPETTTPAPPTTPVPTPAAPPVFEVVTFNAGLARGFVDLAVERAALVAEAVAGIDADVVALQEVWAPADVEAVTAAAADRFPHQRFLEPAPETAGEAACAGGVLDELESCARTACAGVPADQLAECVLANCGPQYGALPETCQSCLAANIGGDLDEIIVACRSGAERYAYGGSFGIGLLSRLPIRSSEELVLESSLNRRAVLYAVLDGGELGPVHVFATHLSPVFADIPYPGEGTWAEEQRRQIEHLLGFVAERVPADEPIVVLGDLNTGPAMAGIAGEVPDNFALLLDTGLAAPYVDTAPSPACTFCSDNPLVGGADDDASVVIDHVLTRGLSATGARRVLDDPVTVDGVVTGLSDHYGVAVTLTIP